MDILLSLPLIVDNISNNNNNQTMVKSINANNTRRKVSAN